MTGSFNASEKSELGSMFNASTTASATGAVGSLTPTTVPSRFTTTSSRAFNDAIPTATGVSSANGCGYHIHRVPGWIVAMLTIIICVFWIH